MNNNLNSSWAKCFAFLCCFIFMYRPSVRGQSNRWILGNVIVDNATSTISSSSSGISTPTGNQYNQSDAVLDNPYGFKIVQEHVFNSAGTYMFDLPYYYTSTYSPGYYDDYAHIFPGETAIVPMPGQTNAYYVIYSFGGLNLNVVCYVIITIDPSTHNPVLSGTQSVLCADAITRTTGTAIQFYANGLPYGTSFAVSKSINARCDRYLFIVGNVDGSSPDLRRLTITSQGIGNDLILQLPDATINDKQFFSHCLKLSPDQHLLAWVASNQHKIWVFPLVNYDSYVNYGFSSNEAYSISTPMISTRWLDGGVEFSPDSRILYYTSPNGLNYRNVLYTDPMSLGSETTITPTISGVNDFYRSDLAMGRNNQLFAINTTTHKLSYFDILGSNTETVSSVTLQSEAFGSYNNTERLPKEVYAVNDHKNIKIARVDLNTKCVPGFSTPAVTPTFSVTVTGSVGPYSYNWYPLPGNTCILSDYHSKNPQITSSTSPYLAHFNIVVWDASRTHQVASTVIKIQMDTTGWDLVTGDSPDDIYDEPNTQLARTGNWNIWLSPFIWNRYLADGATPGNDVNQPPHWDCTTCPNHLYIKVRNFGCKTSPEFMPGTSTKVRAYLYWTMGGSTESWPGDWTTNMITGFGSAGAVPKGQQIVPFTLGPIDPGVDQIYTYTWTPPDPTKYNGTNSMELCFLCRIVDGHDATPTNPDGMTQPEISASSVSYNVRENNNISTLNTSVLNTALGPHTHYTYFGNTAISPDYFTMKFADDAILDLHNGLSTLGDYYNIKVYLGDVYDLWQKSGGRGSYLTTNSNDKSVTFNGSSALILDSIYLDTATFYPVKWILEPLPNVDISTMPPQTIHFLQLCNSCGETVYGGYTYQLEYTPVPKGVLAVTEFSKGPSEQYQGCQYVELLTANCGSDKERYVDVSEWIIDDNSGNFDTQGCTTGFGITQGHYKLAKNKVWQEVPVGSRIVLYNADANCYNLPTTFTIDEINHIYWVPIPATLPQDYVVERYFNNNNESICSYCDDPNAISTNTGAYNWNGTLDFDLLNDAVQVRCPGCIQGNTAFYQGIAYAPSANTDMTPLQATSNSLGGALIIDNLNGGHRKYTFSGTTATSFGSPQYWLAGNADISGTPPPSLGYIDTALYDSTVLHLLKLPCCATPQQRMANNNFNSQAAEGESTGQVKVYPNPAIGSLYFEFAQMEGEALLRIMDISGKIVEQKTVRNNNVAIFNVKGYAPGLYLYNVITRNGTQSGKISIR